MTINDITLSTPQNSTLANPAGLFLKLAAVMGEIGSIPKGGTNTHFNYKFVTADAVADKVRTLLSEHKVAFFASIVGKELAEIRKTTEKTDPKTGEVNRTSTISMRWVVDFAFTFADGESGATMTQSWAAEADSADDKGINKCATAAEKYFLLKTFVVTSADEPDADADANKQRKVTPQQRQQPERQSTVRGAGIPQKAGWISPCIWASKREDWDAFLKSAQERFALDGDAVDTALRKMATCEHVGDWHKSRGWAVAALVAAYCKYDTTLIDAYTSTLPEKDVTANLEIDHMAKLVVTECIQDAEPAYGNGNAYAANAFEEINRDK